jgi:hypothetical protein
VEGVPRVAAEAMLTSPVRHPLSATVGEIQDFFRDDHVHAALIVSPAGHLEAVVERADIAGCSALEAAAAPLGRLPGRTVPPGASLAEVHRAMAATGRRRAAVTTADGRLLGLVCLKASQAGFCSDQDVRTRALGESDPVPNVIRNFNAPFWHERRTSEARRGTRSWQPGRGRRV